MKPQTKHLPLSLFCIYAIKLMIIGVTLVDAPILLVLAASAAFWEFKNQDKNAQTIHKRFDEVDKHLTSVYKELAQAKTDVATLRTASQFQARAGAAR